MHQAAARIVGLPIRIRVTAVEVIAVVGAVVVTAVVPVKCTLLPVIPAGSKLKYRFSPVVISRYTARAASRRSRVVPAAVNSALDILLCQSSYQIV